MAERVRPAIQDQYCTHCSRVRFARRRRESPPLRVKCSQRKAYGNGASNASDPCFPVRCDLASATESAGHILTNSFEQKNKMRRHQSPRLNVEKALDNRSTPRLRAA